RSSSPAAKPPIRTSSARSSARGARVMQSLSNLLSTLNLDEVVNAYDWMWPLFEMLHFVGMSALIGTVGLVDLRILGFFKGIPINQLERLIPIGVVGFIINAA